MRIAYYHQWRYGASTGVFKKIVSQANHWASSGAEVAMFNLSAVNTAAEWQAVLDPQVHFEQVVWQRGKRIQQLTQIGQSVRRLLAWQPDMVYQRYSFYHPAFEPVFRRVPLVLEINSDDLNEARLHSLFRYWLVRLTRSRLLGQASGLVSVSREIIEGPHFSRFQSPAIVIANGIDLREYPLLPPPNNAIPHLVYMGSVMHPWGGADKVIWLAKQLPQWRFDLIGAAPADFAEPLPDNVIAHGELTRSEYQPIMEKADIAVGTLALHRKGMAETSALKVAEYMAYGLPTIIGYQDTNFLNGAEFILELPNAPDNVERSLPLIQQFVTAWMGKRVPHQQIVHVDSAEKEKQRLAFFEQILSV